METRGELLDREKIERNKKLDTLRETEGWVKLSGEQRKKIEMSFFVNQRADRESDENYLLSGSQIRNVYCHLAVASLESEGVNLGDIRLKDKDFFDAEYNEAGSVDELIDRLNRFGYPCVVHLKSPPYGNSKGYVAHSFLVLGKDDKGDIVVWEKNAPRKKYQVESLKVTFEANKGWNWRETQEKPMIYGIRKLRDDDGVEIETVKAKD